MDLAVVSMIMNGLLTLAAGYYVVKRQSIDAQFNAEKIGMQKDLQHLDAAQRECKESELRKDKVIDEMRAKVTVLEAAGVKGRQTSFILYAKMDSLHLIFDVSPSIYQILGRSPAALVGVDVNEIIPVGIRPMHHDGIARFQESGKIRSPNTLIVTKVLHQLGHEVNVAVMIRPQMHRDIQCMKVKVFLIDDSE